MFYMERWKEKQRGKIGHTVMQRAGIFSYSELQYRLHFSNTFLVFLVFLYFCVMAFLATCQKDPTEVSTWAMRLSRNFYPDIMWGDKTFFIPNTQEWFTPGRLQVKFWPGPFCAESAFSPCSCVGSLQLLWLPLNSQNSSHNFKLPIDVSVGGCLSSWPEESREAAAPPWPWVQKRR